LGEISVSRAGDNCGSPPAPCYTTSSDKGYKYSDKLAVADGIHKKSLIGGDAGKGKVTINGQERHREGPDLAADRDRGVAAVQHPGHGLQLLTSDASCFSATVTQVKTADGVQFKATAP